VNARSNYHQEMATPSLKTSMKILPRADEIQDTWYVAYEVPKDLRPHGGARPEQPEHFKMNE